VGGTLVTAMVRLASLPDFISFPILCSHSTFSTSLGVMEELWHIQTVSFHFERQTKASMAFVDHFGRLLLFMGRGRVS